MAVPDEPPAPPLFSPAAIRQLREKNRVSRSTFAHGLNISARTVERWEAGTMKPSGPARRLLGVVQKHGFEFVVTA